MEVSAFSINDSRVYGLEEPFREQKDIPPSELKDRLRNEDPHVDAHTVLNRIGWLSRGFFTWVLPLLIVIDPETLSRRLTNYKVEANREREKREFRDVCV